MDKQRLNFFLTCPYCKRKFGVPPETVFKYMDRFLSEIDDKFKKIEGNLKRRAEEKVRKREP